MILRNKEGNAALVRGDAAGSPPRVHIVINGPVATRRELLGIVRRDFEKINVSIPGLEIKERVPIPGYDIEPLDYDGLVAAEAAGKKTWPILIAGQYSEVRLTEILDGIESKSKRVARAKQLKDKISVKAVNSVVTINTGADSMNIDDHSTNIGGSVINSQVGQSLTNCTNIVGQHPPGERKELLETLTRDVQQLIKVLPAEKKEEAPQVAENLEMLVKQVTGTKPNRKWYSLSAEGLLEASKWVKDFSGNIGGTILNLGKAIWPDFKLPA